MCNAHAEEQGTNNLDRMGYRLCIYSMVDFGKAMLELVET
jgi:hypothetical protein